MRALPTLRRSARHWVVDRPAEETWAVVASTRPTPRGSVWYVDAVPFVIRGGVDRLLLGRGRRWPLPAHPLLGTGDRAGFWEVATADHQTRRLVLTAAVRAPGTVTLEARVSDGDLGPGRCRLDLAVSFAPRGVVGAAYLLADLPSREAVVELTGRELMADLATG